MIISFYESLENRALKHNQRYERDYVRSFIAVSNLRTEDPNVIRAFPLCPKPWQFYVGASGFIDAGSWCREVDVRQDPIDPYTWRVVARYSSRVERPDMVDPHPLLRPAVVTWDTVSVMIPVMFDRKGKPILNSARERFDPPVEIEDARLALRIEVNLKQYDGRLYVKYFNTVNSKEWFRFKPGMARCMRITGTRQFENAVLYWHVGFDFQIKAGTEEKDDKDAWASRILDRGYHKLDDTGKQEKIFIKGMAPVSPVLLDGKGKVLGANADPVFMSYDIFEEQDFNKILRI